MLVAVNASRTDAGVRVGSSSKGYVCLNMQALDWCLDDDNRQDCC